MVKTLAALAEGPGVPVPAPTRQIPTVHNPSARGSSNLVWPPWAPGRYSTLCTYIYTDKTFRHIKINKMLLKETLYLVYHKNSLNKTLYFVITVHNIISRKISFFFKKH